MGETIEEADVTKVEATDEPVSQERQLASELSWTVIGSAIYW